MIKNIKELRKEYPRDKYLLMRRKTPLKSPFKFVLGVYEVAEFSPSKKGAKIPVEYYKISKEI